MKPVKKYRYKLHFGHVLLTLLAVGLVLGGAVLMLKHQGQKEIAYAHELSIESVIIEDVAQIAVHYPKTAYASMNEIIERTIEDRQQTFIEGIVEGGKHLDQLYIDFEVQEAGARYLSVVFSQYEIRAYQANGRSSLFSLTFDVKEEREIHLKDLFKRDDYLSILSGLSYQELSELEVYESSGEREQLAKGLLPREENYVNFALNEAGLMIYFEMYQIGSRANPTDRVLLTWDTLKLYGVENPNLVPIEIVEKEEPKQQAYALIPEATELEDKKLVALTFDDGPHATLTPQLLDILKEHQVRATFFVLGSRVEYYPEIVKRASAEGHQIGNHSYSHRNLKKLSESELSDEIDKTNDAIKNATGELPGILRPPYGAYTKEWAKNLDMKVVLWSVDPEDWKYRDAEKVYDKVISQVEDGSIILLHDIHASSIEAAEKILIKLKEEGYVFVTVGHLIELRAAPDHLNLYSRLRP